MNKVNHPFWVIVNKEISDHVKSWRFIILIGIIALTCMGSLYTALTNISEAIKPNDPDGSFLFLKLFTVSDGTLPSFVLFINFLGPLLGIALGFDAVNSEQNKGTLSRMLSQPIHRDCIINAKFVAALIVICIRKNAILLCGQIPASTPWRSCKARPSALARKNPARSRTPNRFWRLMAWTKSWSRRST